MNKKKQSPVLHMEKVGHVYLQGDRELKVLDDITLDLYPGEMVALVGPSGAGKSTLLHIAGLLERPTSGKVSINKKLTNRMSDKRRTMLRRDVIGFVYQFHHLLPEFTALENVVLPQLLDGFSQQRSKDTAEELIDMFGLSERLQHQPSELSGGEQQRIAIARSLANKPAILLADEPTGNLDTKTSQKVFDELKNVVKQRNLAALIATHNPELAKQMDRTLALVDGVLT